MARNPPVPLPFSQAASDAATSRLTASSARCTSLSGLILIIASVILSWVSARMQHPVVPLVYKLTEPVLAPFRKFIPPIAGIDLSPLFALIAIRFLLLLIGW